jgi:hypothetical protein
MSNGTCDFINSIPECVVNPDTKGCGTPGTFCYRRAMGVGVPFLKENMGSVPAEIEYEETFQYFPPNSDVSDGTCTVNQGFLSPPVHSSDYLLRHVNFPSSQEGEITPFRIMRCVPL